MLLLHKAHSIKEKADPDISIRRGGGRFFYRKKIKREAVIQIENYKTW
jgi:hypothetical protein